MGVAYYFVTWVVSHFPLPLDLGFNALTYGKLACLKRNKQGKREERNEGERDREREREGGREGGRGREGEGGRERGSVRERETEM